MESLSPAIVSLANYNIARFDNGVVTSLIHGIDSIEIEWLGLNARKQNIITIGNMKVGLLAFCSLHTKCSESDSFPFAPIRYSTKASREGIERLKKVRKT